MNRPRAALWGLLAVATVGACAALLLAVRPPRPVAAPAVPGGGARAWRPPALGRGAPPAPAVVCAAGYLAAADGRCAPLDPATGRAYSEAQLRHFDEMRASPFVARGNLVVPQVLSAGELDQRQALLARMSALGERIARGSAAEPEIDEYFAFKSDLVEQRMQILMYMQAEAGGRISRHDPVLEPEAVADPQVAVRYVELEREKRALFEQRMRARERHGLAPQVFADEGAGPAPAHVPGPPR